MRDPSLWRPIHTAPEDGSTVLIFVDGHVLVAAYIDGRWSPLVAGQPVHGAPADVLTGKPTHWRPLPPPPGSPELLHT